MNRWTGRSIWITDAERTPRGWYPYRRTLETHYAPAGRYCRERRRWWPLVVSFRILARAWRDS